jgi:hypothetical protein
MPDTQERSKNKLGNIALWLSAVGVVLLYVCAREPFMWFLPYGPLLCPLGIALGTFALRHSPKRSAAWAIVIGLYGSAHLPTIWLSYAWHLEAMPR